MVQISSILVNISGNYLYLMGEEGRERNDRKKEIEINPSGGVAKI